MQSQPQQPQSLSIDALHMLYRDLGEARHGVYERNIKILGLQAEVEQLRGEVAALKAKYEPAAEAAPEGEPTRLRKGG
jgi:hypothetical protein